MDNPRVTDVVSAAFERTRTICVTRFDVAKWLGLALASWLAWLGSGNQGVNASFSNDDLSWLWDLIQSGDALAFGLLAAFGVVSIVTVIVWVVVSYLRARGQLMFVDLVARDDGDVMQAWGRARDRATELFLLRLGLDALAVLSLGLTTGLGAAVSLGLLEATSQGGWAWVPLGLGALVGFALALFWGFVTFWLDELVVPVAYAWGVPILEAATEVRRMVGAEPATFGVYLVVRVACALLVVWLSLSLSCMLCVIAWIPFVSALILLPFRVFLQGLPLALLHQVDNDAYAAFAPLEPQ